MSEPMSREELDGIRQRNVARRVYCCDQYGCFAEPKWEVELPDGESGYACEEHERDLLMSGSVVREIEYPNNRDVDLLLFELDRLSKKVPASILAKNPEGILFQLQTDAGGAFLIPTDRLTIEAQAAIIRAAQEGGKAKEEAQ